ncbi:MAG: urea transporter, partial [Verrucomicrobiaceae bacterium]
VCLTVGWLHGCYQFQPHIYALLWLAAVAGGLFLSVAMQQWAAVHLGMSAHSLPAVMLAYVLYFLGYALFGPPVMPAVQSNVWFDLNFLPPFLQALFQAFGAMLFQTRALPGLLVFCALAACSPLTCLLAAAAFSVGAGTMSVLGYAMSPEGVTWCGFNFLLCGIALGSGYFIVSRASFVLAMSGAFLCALVALALATALRYFGLPASALPYNLVVLVMVYALKQRRMAGGLVPSPAPGMLPESAARSVLLNAHRFPHLNVPALRPPFEGERTVTQSFDGALTHRGAWRHALDFEIEIEGRMHSGEGDTLKDFAVFGTPVLAPCGGVVAAVTTHVRDNSPGQNNPDENWGNQVIIYADGGFYVRLAHLKQSSVAVHVGQRIECGALLGHCGNSGRSPVPHLHMQIQDTAANGAATRAFCLKHYLEIPEAGGCAVYHTSGVPEVRAAMQNVVPDAALGTMFGGWLPGEYRFRVTGEKGSSWEETVRLDFDEAGRYRLRSRRAHARLTAFLAENVFYATDFEGTDDSLLAYLAIGIARVPCIKGNPVWSDVITTVPFHRAAWRWVHGLLDPFIGPSLKNGSYRMESEGVACVVRSTFAGAENHTPREVAIWLTSRRVMEKLEVRLANDRVIHAELVEFSAVR